MKSPATLILVSALALLSAACESTPYPGRAAVTAEPLGDLSVPERNVGGPASAPDSGKPADARGSSSHAAPKVQPAPSTSRPQNELRMFVFVDEDDSEEEQARNGYEIRFQLFPEFADSNQ